MKCPKHFLFIGKARKKQGEFICKLELHEILMGFSFWKIIIKTNLFVKWKYKNNDKKFHCNKKLIETRGKFHF